MNLESADPWIFLVRASGKLRSASHLPALKETRCSEASRDPELLFHTETSTSYKPASVVHHQTNKDFLLRHVAG